jgi:hypothetical protein
MEFDKLNNKLVWFEGEETSSEALFIFLCVSLLGLFFYMRESLKSPYLQRTILMAKRGLTQHNVAGGKKE